MWAAAMQTAMRGVVKMVYPPRCLTCGGLVETEFGLCGSCWRDTPFVSGLICDTCGLPLPGQSDQAEKCDSCLTTARPWRRGRAALVYQGSARKLVLGLKHGDRHEIATPAALWMANATREITLPDMLVLPVPLHLTRMLKRRYNQSALLAEEMARHLSLEWCADGLRRTKATPSLEGQNRSARFDILEGCFTVTPSRRGLVRDRPVLIVDDVMTTGATLAAAAEACFTGGACQVMISVLARVAKDD